VSYMKYVNLFNKNIMNSMKRNALTIICVWIFLCLLCFETTAFGQNKTVHVTVNVAKVTGNIPIGIYGHFLEHILGSVNGGLWGELVMNRSFEDVPLTPRNNRGGAVVPSITAPIILKWETVGPIIATSDTTNPLNGKRSIKLVASMANAGIRQTGFLFKKR